MSKILEPVIGNFAFFLPEGTVVDSVTVSKTVKPDSDPTTNYTDFGLGCIQDAQMAQAFQGTKEIFKATTGGYKLAETRHQSSTLSILLSMQEVGKLEMGLAFGAASVDAGDGSFVPNSITNLPQGLLRIQSYNTANEDNIVLLDAWVELSLPNPTLFSVTPLVPQIQANVLDAAVNEGVIDNLD